MSVSEDVVTARRCPSCGSEDRPAHSRVSSVPPAESVAVDELRDSWTGFFQNPRLFFTYERCRSCGLLYCPTYLEAGALSGLYSSMDDNTNGVPARLAGRTQAQYFRQLAKFSPLAGTYLELGPDIGTFTSYVVERGRFDRYLLCEPNVEVHDRLRAFAGVRAEISSQLSDIDSLKPGDRVDAVVMIHVLDHLVDPVAVLRRLRPHCHDKTTLLFVTHDESSLLARLLRARWPAYSPQHPLLYRRSTITQLLRRAGFEVVATKKAVNWFPAGYLARHLTFALGGPDLRLPCRGPALPLPLGNFITVARPKRSTLVDTAPTIGGPDAS